MPELKAKVTLKTKEEAYFGQAVEGFAQVESGS
jgi:hypothetical protein